MIGYLHLDVPTVTPKLETGGYFILWQNSSLAEHGPTPGALLFKGVGERAVAPPVRFTEFLPAVQTADQPLSMTADPAKNTVVLQLPFPGAFERDTSFVLTLSLGLEPGVAAKLE